MQLRSIATFLRSKIYHQLHIFSIFLEEQFILFMRNMLVLNEQQIVVNLAVLGGSKTGKTSLLECYQLKSCPQSHFQTRKTNLKDYRKQIHGRQIKIRIVDTSGSQNMREQMKAAIFQRYQIVNFIVMVDLSNRQSVQAAKYWLSIIKDKKLERNVLVLSNKKTEKTNKEQESSSIELSNKFPWINLKPITFKQPSYLNEAIDQFVERLITNSYIEKKSDIIMEMESALSQILKKVDQHKDIEDIKIHIKTLEVAVKNSQFAYFRLKKMSDQQEIYKQIIKKLQSLVIISNISKITNPLSICSETSLDSTSQLKKLLIIPSAILVESRTGNNLTYSETSFNFINDYQCLQKFQQIDQKARQSLQTKKRVHQSEHECSYMNNEIIDFEIEYQKLLEILLEGPLSQVMSL